MRRMGKKSYFHLHKTANFIQDCLKYTVLWQLELKSKQNWTEIIIIIYQFVTHGTK